MLKEELFDGFPIFSDIPQEHLLEIAQWGKISEFDKGETIFHVGEKAFNLHGAVNGEVELSLVARDELLKTDIKYEESIQIHI